MEEKRQNSLEYVQLLYLADFYSPIVKMSKQVKEIMFKGVKENMTTMNYLIEN